MPEFASQKAAVDWLYEQMQTEECVDNFRFAFVDDPLGMALYLAKQQDGCCGFFDREILVEGRKAHIGCNYGH